MAEITITQGKTRVFILRNQKLNESTLQVNQLSEFELKLKKLKEKFPEETRNKLIKHNL